MGEVQGRLGPQTLVVVVVVLLMQYVWAGGWNKWNGWREKVRE
jgi:hypothetical protein